MYISHLRIKNFRNFGDPAFEIALKPFTVLLGENNIGKTNLLSAIALVFSQELSVAQRRSLDIDDINYDAVSKFKAQVADSKRKPEDVQFPEVVIDATLVAMNDEQHDVVGDWYVGTDLSTAQVSYRYAIRSTFNKLTWIAEQRTALDKARKDAAKAKSTTFVATNFVDFPIREYRHTIFGGNVASNECESYYLNMLRVELLDALRDAKNELVAGGEQRLLYRVLSQGSDTRYSDLKDHLLNLEQAVSENSALSQLKTEVEALLKRVSLATQGDANNIAFHFSAPDAAELLKKIGLQYGTNPISVARNGLGRNNLLYVALVLSQLSKPGTASSSGEDFVCFRFVGIEEPEAHLHPHLQDHLASNIESVGQDNSTHLQLLLTSHSTHIAAKLSLENTAIVFRDSSTGRLASHYVLDGIDTVKEKEAIRFLSLYLDATKSRMFFAKKLLLVEGIAEQLVVPELFRSQTQNSLESVGCSLLNVNGVAFRHFLTVVKNGFFTRCAVLTDQDTGTVTEDRATNLKKKFEDGKVIVVQITKEATFEKDLIAANVSGAGKDVLLEALTKTKPTNGPKFTKTTGSKTIDVNKFFDEISDCKAAFAYNLVATLRGSSSKLTIPQYIVDAFKFIT